MHIISYGPIPVNFNTLSLFIFKQFISLRVERCSRKKNNQTSFYRTVKLIENSKNSIKFLVKIVMC